MNAEMKAKLEQYMQADGTYDVAAVRAAFPGNDRAVFDSLWDDEGDVNADATAGYEHMSPEWRAAVEHNERVQMINDLGACIPDGGAFPHPERGNQQRGEELKSQGYELWTPSRSADKGAFAYEDTDIPAYLAYENSKHEYIYHIEETTTSKIGKFSISNHRVYVLVKSIENQ